MKNRIIRRRVAVFAVLLVAATGGSLAAAMSQTELKWIGGIPGLSVLSQETKSKYTETSYTVSGSVGKAMKEVREGLIERGWDIRNEETGTVGVVTGHEFVADKNGSRVSVEAADVLGVKVIEVRLFASAGAKGGQSSAIEDEENEEAGGEVILRDGSGSQVTVKDGQIILRDSGGDEATIRSSGKGTTVRASSGGDVYIGDSVTETYDCTDGDVILDASSAEITLVGDCGELVINGSFNTVRVDARVDSIVTNGASNVVTWSAEANPIAPDIANLGRNNKIRRVEE